METPTIYVALSPSLLQELAACRRELMKWGRAVTISLTSATIGAQEGFGGQLCTPGGWESGILTISPTNC